MTAVALLLPFSAAAQQLSPPPAPLKPASSREPPRTEPAALFHPIAGAIGVGIAPDTEVVFKMVTFRGNQFWKRTPAALPTTLDLASDRVPVAGLRVKF